MKLIYNRAVVVLGLSFLRDHVVVWLHGLSFLQSWCIKSQSRLTDSRSNENVDDDEKIDHDILRRKLLIYLAVIYLIDEMQSHNNIHNRYYKNKYDHMTFVFEVCNCLYDLDNIERFVLIWYNSILTCNVNN